MKQKSLGNSGINASIVGLGAWVLGGGQIWGKNEADEDAVRTIQAALDMGISLIDTAPAYGWGKSETIVGKAVKGRRDKAIIATKCGLWWHDQRGSFFAELDGQRMHRSLRPDTIQIEIEDSLKRMDVDCIDLYQTHWPSMPPDFTPIQDSMAVLLDLKKQGKIRAIGVSNVSLAELEENVRCGNIVSNQFRYSMLHREAEAEMLPACKKHGLSTLTYMSLEQGLLTGKIGMDRVFKPEEFRSNSFWNDWMIPTNRKKVLDLLASWKDLTAKYNCTLSQLVIAWTAAQPGVTHVLAGGRNIEQVRENAKAGEMSIEAADLERIRKNVEALGQPQKE